MIKRNILLVGDLHVGSEWAIFPKDFITDGGNKIVLNTQQEELLMLWKQMQEDLCGVYDTVFLMGDLVNGLSKKSFGKHQIVSDLNEQDKATMQLLEPICKGKHTIGISGSQYHMSADYEIDKHICEMLNGQFVGPVRNIKIKGSDISINIAHGGGSAPVYLGTKMTREILQSLMSTVLKKIPDVQIICRAHHHTYAYMNLAGRHFVLNPCWEGARLDLYSAPHYFRFQPDIGVTLISIHGDEITIKPFLYELKHETESMMEI